MDPDARLPDWIKWSLTTAGLYNLVWGGLVILFPSLFFKISGLENRPQEPWIWQGMGMVIGVYGLGYLIAANNPVRHWPIILVGLLGKVLGPIGFAIAMTQDPDWIRLSWMILLNDLIWWPSFGASLWIAAREHQPGMGRPLPEVTEDTLNRFTNQAGQSLEQLSLEQPTLVVFLRHAGCTFCREALADLRKNREQLEQQGVQIALVHMGTEEQGQAFFANYGLQDVPQFSDPDRQLYRYFDLKLGKFSQLFGPRVWWRGFFAAIVRGHGVGKLQGNGFQMAGTFLLHQGKIIKGYPLKDASDRPDYCALAQPST
jgi:peroxiredoxin